MEVSAVLNSTGQVEVTLQIMFEHCPGPHPLPVQHIVQGVTVGNMDGDHGDVSQLGDGGRQGLDVK